MRSSCCATRQVCCADRSKRPEATDAVRTLLGAIAAALARPSRAGWLVTPDALLRFLSLPKKFRRDPIVTQEVPHVLVPSFPKKCRREAVATQKVPSFPMQDRLAGGCWRRRR